MPGSDFSYTEVDHDPFQPQDSAAQAVQSGARLADVNETDASGNPLWWSSPKVSNWAKVAGIVADTPRRMLSGILDTPQQAVQLGNDVQTTLASGGDITADQAGRSLGIAAGLVGGGMPLAEEGALGVGGGRLTTGADTPFQLQPWTPQAASHLREIQAVAERDLPDSNMAYQLGLARVYGRNYLDRVDDDAVSPGAHMAITRAQELHDAAVSGAPDLGNQALKQDAGALAGSADAMYDPAVHGRGMTQDQLDRRDSILDVFGNYPGAHINAVGRFLDKAGTDLPGFAQRMGMGDSYSAQHLGNGSVRFDADLMNEAGDPVGSMTRTLHPNGNVSHDYLKIDPSAQNASMAKQILAGQVDLYNQMGMRNVSLLANLDIGGYAWARYGFTPTQQGWASLRPELKAKLGAVESQLHPDTAADLSQLVRSSDPKAAWDLVDDKTPIYKPYTREPDTLGRYLFRGSDWNGRLNLRDPEAMQRFNDYVGSSVLPR